jgi:hypothetical protein
VGQALSPVNPAHSHSIAHAENLCHTDATVGVVSMVMIQKLRKNALCLMQFACFLPVVCGVVVTIAYRAESTTPKVTILAMRSPSMRCNDAVEIFKQLSVDDPARYSSLVTQVCNN